MSIYGQSQCDHMHKSKKFCHDMCISITELELEWRVQAYLRLTLFMEVLSQNHVPVAVVSCMVMMMISTTASDVVN